MHRALILAEAREWIGTRWHHQTSRKGVACDCAGLIVGVACALALPGCEEMRREIEYWGYGRQPDPVKLIKLCDQFLERRDWPDARPGDVIVMRFDKDPQHFGFLSRRDPDYVIHAYAQARKVVENRIDALWRSRVVVVAAFRGLDG